MQKEKSVQMPLEEHIVYDKDMLSDMFMRNKKFTDFAREHSPRGLGLPESAIKTSNIIGSGYKQPMIEEIRSMRVALAMMDELSEYITQLPFKWWGRGAQEVDKKKALEELIDLLHFFFVAVDDLGFNAKDIYDMYVLKNNHNWKRFTDKIGWGKTRLEHDDHPEVLK
jgi:hypothetical protein